MKRGRKSIRIIETTPFVQTFPAQFITLPEDKLYKFLERCNKVGLGRRELMQQNQSHPWPFDIELINRPPFQ